MMVPLLMRSLLCLLLPAVALAQPPALNSRLEDQIRGGLLGQIIANLNGLQHENKYFAEPGNVTAYTPALPDGAWTDDDTDIEWVYLLAMERSGVLFLSPARIADLWKAHINRNIWCSHKYVRQLMNIGFVPPLTGSPVLNPWASFNLSGQFVSESWGLIAPGRPRTAARLAVHYIHASVDGEPIQAAQLFSSMVAMAFVTSDLNRILDAGQASVDPGSEMARVVRNVRDWHRQYPDDWRRTRALIQSTHSKHPLPKDIRDYNGVLLNGAATIAAILYGQGDFTETARHAFNFGWDADNTAATACTIIGVLQGERRLKSNGWLIAYRFRNTSRDGLPDETITRFGDRLIRLARRVLSEPAALEEKPANVEPLRNPLAQAEEFRAATAASLERTLLQPDASEQELARAAYAAIAAGLAPGFQASHGAAWKSAVEALAGYRGLVQVLFHDSPGEPGARLRFAALAAGLPAPPKAQ
jgi:hypothetical protein